MVLRIAVFGSGAILMALEILAFRVIGKTFGTALRETTAVISVFLISMSTGYYLGGKFGDRWPQYRTLVLAMTGAGLSMLFIPMLDTYISERVFQSALPRGTHALITCFVLFTVPSLLMASVSPVAIRLTARVVEETGKVSGGIAALSTAGSILGTLLTGFYLIDTFRITRLVYALGCAMLLFAGLPIAAGRLRR